MSHDEVTAEVFEQYQEIQRAGPVNMADKTGVQRAAYDRDLHALVVFIEDGDYYDLLTNYGEYADRFGGDE